MDALLAPGEPGGTAELDALTADPAAAAERDRLAAFLRAAAAAHEVTLDSAAPERVAARVTWRVHAEEDRSDRAPAPRHGWGRLWARVLAVSVAVHAVVIVGLAISMRGSATPPSVEGLDDRAVPMWSDERDTASVDPSPVEEPLPAPVAPYAGGLADLPIGPVLASLPDADVASSRALEPSDPAVLRRWFPASVSRSMWLRSEAGAPARAEILRRLGVPALATRPPPTLDALAQRQARDGSFDAMEGHGRVQSTATVLLAFESEGHGSRAGTHRAVVENGVRFLRHELGLDASPKDGAEGSGEPPLRAKTAGDAWALMALTEDVMLSSGAWTPGETRARVAEVRRLAETVGARRDAGGLAGLATSAASRLRSTGSPARGWADSFLQTASAGPDVLRGTAILVSGRTAEFTEWVTTVLPRVESKFALDGLVRGGSPGARVEETALALLALQVPYRTY